MAYDPNRAKVVLFGGSNNSVASGYSGVLSDTWEFDPVANTWTNKAPATTPDADAFPSVQYDPVHKRIVMFAMQKNATAGTLHEWTWDGTDWTLLVLGPEPPDTAAFEQAASTLGLLLQQVHHADPALRTLYEAPLCLIRPDHIVAWRGHIATDALAVLETASGRGRQTA